MATIQFFVMDELTGQQTGPYSLQQIQEQILNRTLKKKDFVRRADSAQWGKASVILGQVFDNVALHKKEQKQQLKADKVAKKQQDAQAKTADKRDRQHQQKKTMGAAQDSVQIQTARKSTSRGSNRRPGVIQTTRFLYRIANLSGWVLMVIGFSIIAVVCYIFLNAFVIAPAVSAADGVMKDNRKNTALAKIGEKMPQVADLDDDERREIRWDTDHPLFYYVRFYDDWIELRKKPVNTNNESKQERSEEVFADENLFRDAGFLHGLELDPGVKQSLTGAIQGSFVNLFLLGAAIPFFFIAFGSSIAAWSSAELQK